MKVSVAPLPRINYIELFMLASILAVVILLLM